MMRRSVRALVCSMLCLPFAACASDEKASQGGSDELSLADGYENGSRLHAVVRVAGEARSFATWHDTELDADCSFGLASDGATRCVPLAAYSSNYSDADCKTPVVTFGDASEVMKYVYLAGEGFACGRGFEMYETGEKIASAELTI
jgi:hypothetical protein